jgi:hypothetical protein
MIMLVYISDYLDDGGYLGRLIERNWQTNYITDVMFSKDSKCGDVTGFSSELLGSWSGFDGMSSYERVIFY